MLPSLETAVGEVERHLPALGLVVQRAPCRAQGHPAEQDPVFGTGDK